MGCSLKVLPKSRMQMVRCLYSMCLTSLRPKKESVPSTAKLATSKEVFRELVNPIHSFDLSELRLGAACTKSYSLTTMAAAKT